MEVSLGAGGAATCRCCLAPGVAAKDLSSEYDFMGEKEVYADMLLESFDITLSRAVNAGWVICDSCITRLRDSSNFKKQVLHSEKCLLQKSKAGVASTEDVAESKLELTVLKQEEDSDDDHADFETLFYDEEDHNELKKPVVKTEPLASTSNDMSNDEDVPLSSLTAGVKRKARPIKTDTLPKYLRVGPKQLKDPPVRLKVLPAASAKTAPKAPLPRPAVKVGGIKVQLAKESAQKLATSKLSGRQLKITLKNPSTAAVKKGLTRQVRIMEPTVSTNTLILQDRETQRRNDLMMKNNTYMLLRYSNVVPFKWSLPTGYRCFYCEHPYTDIQELRAHTRKHFTDKLLSVLRKLRKEYQVKVDILSIQCTLCAQTFKDIEVLRVHLNETHKKQFFPHAGLGVLPFRLVENKYECAICEKMCSTFHTLNQHVMKHFENYICHTCGEGFISSTFLRLHIMKHTSSYKCSICEKSFPSDNLRRSHKQKDHGQNKFKCEQCPAAFGRAEEKRKHSIQVHNAKELEFKCESCDKTFAMKPSLALHRRKVHLKERLHHCSLCSKSFFSPKALRNHSVVHTGARDCLCPVCSKGFSTKRILELHMRIHNNDRRYACKICEKAFVQVTSLKVHIRVHHPKVAYEDGCHFKKKQAMK